MVCLTHMVCKQQPLQQHQQVQVATHGLGCMTHPGWLGQGFAAGMARLGYRSQSMRAKCKAMEAAALCWLYAA
jgi:hypothetical protein